jgi:hypothetical protein
MKVRTSRCRSVTARTLERASDDTRSLGGEVALRPPELEQALPVGAFDAALPELLGEVPLLDRLPPRGVQDPRLGGGEPLGRRPLLLPVAVVVAARTADSNRFVLKYGAG